MIELGDFVNNYRILSKVADSDVSSTYVAEQTPAGTFPVLLTLWHGVRLMASEDVQIFLKKANHGVLLKNSQTIPLLDAQLYHQSPYIVTALDANTSLDAHTPLIDQVIDNKRALHPDDPRSSIEAFLSIFGSPFEERTIPDSRTVPANNHVIGLNQWMHKSRGRRSYIAASILLLLALLAGGMTYLYLPAKAATVTITPMSKRITHAYPISLVTDKSTVGQIKEHMISYTTSLQSQTVPVTGKHPATQAQGQVVISQIHLFNASDNNSPIEASDVPANDGTMITVGTFTATEGGTVTVNANATKAGVTGNVYAYDINDTYGIFRFKTDIQIGTAYVQNPSAFTGGQDAYTFVQQQDIDAVVNPLSAQLTPSAQQQAQQELQSGEQLVQDLTCTNSVSTDHKVQETADSVTVTVQVTCSGVAYNKQDLLTATINAQKAAAITQLGTKYQPSGDITTGVPSLDTSSTDGSVVYKVPTDGIWVFQIDGALEREVARSIAGRTQQDATNLLLQRKGIKSVVISTTGSIGTALPTSPGSIKFIIIPVSGLASR